MRCEGWVLALAEGREGFIIGGQGASERVASEQVARFRF